MDAEDVVMGVVGLGFLVAICAAAYYHTTVEGPRDQDFIEWCAGHGGVTYTGTTRGAKGTTNYGPLVCLRRDAIIDKDYR